MDTFGESHEHVQEEKSVSTLVSNGGMDYRGEVADKRKTGAWKASSFIIVSEVAERLAFYAIAVNLGVYLVREMNQSIPVAATHVTDWTGAAYMLTILGAFLADAYLGRFKTIIIFSCVYSLGMALLTVSASVDSLRPPQCKTKPCIEANAGQTMFLFCAMGLIAIGTGGIKPCVSAFGADQYDERDEKEVQQKYGFFNWFFFSINMGAIFGITVCVYIQEQKGWTVGFAIPTACMIFSVIVLIMGIRRYRYQKPMGSPLTRFLQVIVAAINNHYKGVAVSDATELYEVKTIESDILGAHKLPHTPQFRFLDKAAVIIDMETVTKDRWSLCTVTQVEELKSFLRILPIWVTTLGLPITFAQVSTFFLSQAGIMNRKLGSNFTIPIGSITIFTAMNAVVLVPVYEKMVPLFRKLTGHKRGLSSLQRMGVGLFFSLFGCVSAALVEQKRREKDPEHFSMSVFWLFPQFFFMGTAEVFTYVGCLEFFYDEATEGTKSISNALFLSEIGIGSWISSVLVKTVDHATGGEEKGWLRNDLNKSKLDYFYWILAGINVFILIMYLWASWSYKGRGTSNAIVGDESAVELSGQEKEREM